MDKLFPIGTFLLNHSTNGVGMVVGYNSKGTYYDVDSDNSWFWMPDEVEQISEQDALFLRLKYE